MAKVQILTNSVSDMSPALAQREGVILVADTIAFGPQEQYLNNVDIDPLGLYRKLAQAEKLPTTSHPNIDQYQQAFRSVEPGTEILCITLTSKMSGSYNTACTAAKLLAEQGDTRPITVYDSLQVSYGLTVLVVEAARMAREGATVAQIVERLDQLRDKVGVYFVMESLENARKGGRVGAIRVLAADLLKVKPILNFRDGLVRDIGIVRGYDTALEKVISLCLERRRRGGEVFVFHADRPQLAEKVKARILADDPDAVVHIEWVGAVIGIYTGPGCVGMAFLQP